MNAGQEGLQLPTPLAGSSEDTSLRVGPYLVAKELTRAPGAWMVEATLATGESVLLQLAHLRAPRAPEEVSEQGDYVLMIRTATEHLASDPESAALLHGAEDYADGTKILYWALPLPGDAHRIGHARTLIGAAENLVKVALSLLTRMKTRHERGRLEPLLSEQLVLTLPDGTATLVGIPIHLPPDWLAEDMIPARLAPEEKAALEPRRTGDLWRLGQALKVIATELDLLPPDLRHVLDRLVEPDPTRRISSASEALEEFRSLLVQSTAWTQAVDPSRLSAEDAPLPDEPAQAPRGFSHVARDLAGELEEHPPVPPTRSLTSSDPHITVPPSAQPTVAEAAAPHALPPPDDDAPTWEPRESATQRVQLPESRPQRPIVASPPPGPIRAPSTLNVPEQATILDLNPTIRHYGRPPTKPEVMIPPAALYQQTVIDERPPEIPEEVKQVLASPPAARPKDPGSEATLRDLPRKALEDQGESPTIDDATLKKSGPPKPNAWDRAKVPTGANPVQPMGPKGTVVGVRMIDNPTGLRKLPELAGSGGLLPPPPVQAQLPSGPIPRAPDTPPTPEGDLEPPRTPRPELRRSGEHLALPVRRPETGSQPVRRSGDYVAPVVSAPPAARPAEASNLWKNILLGALGFFVAGGLAALALPYLLPRNEVPWAPPPPTTPPPPVSPKEVVQIAPHGDVILKSVPEGALVVSEEDGRVLGPTPLRFMVPPGGAPILVTAPGFEPQRLVLPDRGRVTAELLELQEKRPCDLALTVPGNADLEGVAATVEIDNAHTVQGSAVLRAKNGSGAWIVRCPSYGGAEQQTLPTRRGVGRQKLEILSPSDGVVSVDGRELGKVPQTTEVESRFVNVRVELEPGVAIERWVPVNDDTSIRLPRPKKKKADEVEAPTKEAPPEKEPPRRRGKKAGGD